ncbi:MAG: FAD-dependent oxidoreductase [Blastocatellia bacterium]|nr:FAD-dependent oxidoreductase [Blastocatellia bacterium]
MIKTYDVIVVGAGVFGSWTAYELMKRGHRVGLLDAYGAANSRASSGDESRIIRLGYGANEIYTRWSLRSLGSWRALSEEAGQPFFQCTGVLRMAREDDPDAMASAKTLRSVGAPFEELRREELADRFPQIAFEDVDWAFYEPESGVLLARRAVQEVTRRVREGSGEMRTAAIAMPTERGRLSAVATSDGEKLGAGAFVFACGPWLPKLFPELLGGRIHPTRQEVCYFGVPAGDGRFSSPRMPAWIDFGAEFYGLPDLEGRGFKIGLDRHGPAIDPDTDERMASPEILSQTREFLARRFPALKNAPLLETRVCQYENTSNGDFLIDRHPALDNVWLVGGGSGHGFKHGPALGEYVADLLGGSAEPDPRFALSAKATFRERAVF